MREGEREGCKEGERKRREGGREGGKRGQEGKREGGIVPAWSARPAQRRPRP